MEPTYAYVSIFIYIYTYIYIYVAGYLFPDEGYGGLHGAIRVWGG